MNCLGNDSHQIAQFHVIDVAQKMGYFKIVSQNLQSS